MSLVGGALYDPSFDIFTSIYGGGSFGKLLSVRKSLVGMKVVGGASKYTLITSALFHKVGVRGLIGMKVYTLYGAASSLQAIFGRWTTSISTTITTNIILRNE